MKPTYAVQDYLRIELAKLASLFISKPINKSLNFNPRSFRALFDDPLEELYITFECDVGMVVDDWERFSIETMVIWWVIIGSEALSTANQQMK